MLTILLALTSAILFATGLQLTKVGLRYTNPPTATLITIISATVLYWLLAPLFVEARFWLTRAALIFVAIGLFRPVFTVNLAMTGTHYLGPTLSSTLSATAPLFGLVLGVFALGERLTVSVLIGTCIIVAGVVALTWRRGPALGWPAWALLLPVAAAVMRSFAHMLTKLGLYELPSPFFAGLVANSVSLVLAVAYCLRPANRPEHIPPRRGLTVLGVAGVLHGLSLLSLNAALERGELIVVSPIIASVPLFSLLLGLLVFRQEVINRRVVLAVVLVVGGVVLVTLHR